MVVPTLLVARAVVSAHQSSVGAESSSLQQENTELGTKGTFVPSAQLAALSLVAVNSEVEKFVHPEIPPWSQTFWHQPAFSVQSLQGLCRSKTHCVGVHTR